MNQQEILDYNKRCAEFLKAFKRDKREKVNPLYIFPDFRFYKAEMQPDYMGGSYLEHDENCNISYSNEMKFHSDWNWIHEVIEAIEKLEFGEQKYKFQVDIQNNHCVIEQSNCFNSIRIYKETKKEATTEAINKFLIWYEQNK